MAIPGSDTTLSTHSAPEPGLRGSALQRLKWAAVATPLVLFTAAEYARWRLLPDTVSHSAQALLDGALVLGLVAFYVLLFSFISQIGRRLAYRNRELLALHRAVLDISGELALDAVLTKVVEQARSLLEARYGALSVLDARGRITQFITSGVSPEERARIGSPPRGTGLLGLPLHERQSLRLADAASDPRASGLPPHHPRIRSLLAVPILCKGPFSGNLYVANKETGEEFSAEDEETLARFATAAAVSIDSAHLHARLRTLAIAEERVRIAREMHDGLAQVLAYVNTKAQAVGEFLRGGKVDEAQKQLGQLAAAAREVYTDVREGIIGLRTRVDGDRTLGEALRRFLEAWQDQSGIPVELAVQRDLRLPAGVEIQLLRIVQEALSNVRKHSGARRAQVELAAVNGAVTASIEDDGRGFDLEHRQRGDHPRFGLAIMRERAEGVGGRLQITSAPGEGTRIDVQVPLESQGLGGTMP